MPKQSLSKKAFKKIKKKSVSFWKKKADAVFSIFIRQRGKGICFTCGLMRTWKEMQCGHFNSRSHSITRYDEINCQSQCLNCNIWRRGNIPEFALRLDEKYGLGTASALTIKAREKYQLTVPELQEIITKYKLN